MRTNYYIEDPAKKKTPENPETEEEGIILGMKKTYFYALVAVIVLILAGLGFYFFMYKKSDTSLPTQTSQGDMPPMATPSQYIFS